MARLLRRKPRRILIDVDIQFDHFALRPEVNNSALLRNIRRLFAWARVHKVPTISTELCRRDLDAHKLESLRPLCIEGTSGQKKIPYTLMPHYKVYGPEASTDLPRHPFSEAQQIIFEKRTEDPFEHPRADRMLTEIRADELIIFGMDIECAIKATALGLRRRRKNVCIVTDAIFGFEKSQVSLALRQMEAKGVKPIKTSDLAGKSALLSAAGITISA